MIWAQGEIAHIASENYKIIFREAVLSAVVKLHCNFF